VLVSIFLPWYKVTGVGDITGWDLTKAAKGLVPMPEMVAPQLLLGTAILIILTCLVLLWKPQEVVEALMGTFTVLAAASAVGVFVLETTGKDMGYGAYVLLIGAILALIALLVKKPEK
jgi:FtsH-binding integral membrane protein